MPNLKTLTSRKFRLIFVLLNFVLSYNIFALNKQTLSKIDIQSIYIGHDKYDKADNKGYDKNISATETYAKNEIKQKAIVACQEIGYSKDVQIEFEDLFYAFTSVKNLYEITDHENCPAWVGECNDKKLVYEHETNNQSKEYHSTNWDFTINGIPTCIQKNPVDFNPKVAEVISDIKINLKYSSLSDHQHVFDLILNLTREIILQLRDEFINN